MQAYFPIYHAATLLTNHAVIHSIYFDAQHLTFASQNDRKLLVCFLSINFPILAEMHSRLCRDTIILSLPQCCVYLITLTQSSFHNDISSSVTDSEGMLLTLPELSHLIFC